MTKPGGWAGGPRGLFSPRQHLYGGGAVPYPLPTSGFPRAAVTMVTGLASPGSWGTLPITLPEEGPLIPLHPQGGVKGMGGVVGLGIKNLVPKPVLTMGSLHQSELPTLAASKGDGSGAPSSHQHHNVGAQEAGPCSTVIHATVPPQGKRQRKIKCPLGLEQLLELKQRGEWMAYVSAHVGGPDRGWARILGPQSRASTPSRTEGCLRR